MHLRGRVPWLAAVLLAALAYPAFGVVFGALAGRASAAALRTVWRAAAFAASGVVFLAHVRAEVLGRGSAARTAAWRAALAVAVGACLLAALGPLRAHGLGSRRALAALVVWPAITALPLWGVAWALAAGLRRRARAGGRPRAGVG